MQILAWKAVSGALGTNRCKKHRHKSTRDTFPLCGTEKETSFHALVTCEHARAVWTKMRQVWDLPDQELLQDTGKDWLLNILVNCQDHMRDCTIMLLCRIWSLRSDLAHSKAVPSTDVTADYLQSYMSSLHLSRKFTTEEIMKGKMSTTRAGPVAQRPAVAPQPWPTSPAGSVALSVDGAYSASGRWAAAGIVRRRQDGSVIFAAYRCIFNCNDALEAEIHALMQGMALAIQHCNVPIIVHSDSSEALLAMKGDCLSCSAYGHMVAEIKLLMGEREFIPLKIKRDQNRVADRLDLYSRMERSTAVWLGKSRPCIEELVPLDCNPINLE